MPHDHERKERVKAALEKHAFVRADDETTIVSRSGKEKQKGWIFDIRNILLDGAVLKDISGLFWDQFADEYPFQIGGIETAAIPLVTALVVHGHARGHHDISGFFIRKSRKKTGLMQMIEGELRDGKIILVDDLVNSGKSLIRQVEVIESEGRRVHAIWTLVRFRNPDYYTYFNNKGIAIHSLFTLDDFHESLGTNNLQAKEKEPRQQPYSVQWKFASEGPSYHYVAPKSDPIIDATRVYVGSDIGVMWALNQSDGSVAWKHTIGFHSKGKGIFSSPALDDGTLFFGGYDGNVYALDASTGARKWINFDADWIGSSPALAPEHNLLFIGLEFGLWRKRGGIAAINMHTGKTVWSYREMPNYTHSTPLFIREHSEVVIGSNDGVVYCFDAAEGTLKWKCATGVATDEELNTGFSAHDIKESCAFDAARNLIICGNRNGALSCIDRTSGEIRGTFKAEFGFFSTPVVQGDTVLAASLDKNLYCIDLDTFVEKWRWYAGARIFATPTLIDGSIYIGANTGRLTELDPETGSERSFLALTERITNKVAYNPTTQRFFVPTFANEIYCIEKV